MSRDHRPPIRNPFVTPAEPTPGPAAVTEDPGVEDRLAPFRLGPAFGGRAPAPKAPEAPGPKETVPEDAVPEAPGPPATVRVLAVCTGNICRSAYVQHALQAHLTALFGERARAEVTSAGTGPNQALAVPKPLLDCAPSRRVRAALTDHSPRALTARLLRDQDLVLTATDDHLDEVLREDPAAVHRTFTVLGVGTLLRDHGAQIAQAVPPGVGMPALVEALAALRGRLISGGERPDEDLPDPFRGPDEGYAAMAQTLQPVVELLAWEIARAVDGDLVEDEETPAP